MVIKKGKGVFMEAGLKSIKEMKAGYLYKVCVVGGKPKDTIYKYIVCIGKDITVKSHYCLLVSFIENVPKEANLVNFPLSKFNRRKVEIYAVALSDANLSRYVCLGKICEPTEQAIKAWLTQLKLSGYIVEAGNSASVCNYYIGDWRKRKKLPYVLDLQAGHWYVKEELAYMRMKTPYQSTDVIWNYVGMQSGGDYLWNKTMFEYRMGRVTTGRLYHLTNNLKGMVELRINQQGCQEI
jgi:hypothetical protein